MNTLKYLLSVTLVASLFVNAASAQKKSFIARTEAAQIALVKQIKKKIGPSLVYFDAAVKQRRSRGGNSWADWGMAGFIVDEEGHFVTRYFDPGQVKVLTSCWYKGKEYDVEKIEENPTKNLVIYKIQADDVVFSPVTLGSSADLISGQWLASVASSGRALNFTTSVSIGNFDCTLEGEMNELIVSGLRNIEYKADGKVVIPVIGTPVVDRNAKVVGMFFYNNMLMGIDDVAKVIERLLDKAKQEDDDDDDEQKPVLGFVPTVLNEDYAKALDIPTNGILVQHVYKGYPAYEAGMEPNDVITAVDGVALKYEGQRAYNEFRKTLVPEVDAVVEYSIFRNGKILTLKPKYVKKEKAKTFRVEQFGFTVKEIDPIEYYTKVLPVEEGIFITSIENGSSAMASANGMGASTLNKNDVIVEFNGRPVSNIETLREILKDTMDNTPEVILVKTLRGFTTYLAFLETDLGQKTKLSQ